MIQGVNLIPVYRRQARRTRLRTRRWAMGCAAYALLLLVGWITIRSISGGAGHAVASELGEVQAAIDQTNQAIAQMQPRLAQSKTTLAASRSVGSQPDWSVLMGLVAQLLGDDTVLVSCRIEPVRHAVVTAPAGSAAGAAAAQVAPPQRYLLRISGLGQTHAAVAGFVLRLEQTQLFDTVKLIDTRKEPFRSGEAIGFHIECALSGSQGGEG